MLRDIKNCLGYFLSIGNITITTRSEEKGVIAIYVWGREKESTISEVKKILTGSYQVNLIIQKTDSVGEITFIEARRKEEE